MAEGPGSTGPVDAQPEAQLEAQADHEGVAVPTAGAFAWVVVGVLGAVTAPWLVVPGVVGMVAGSIAHLKGHRLGMPVAVASGATTVVGMALAFWTG